MLIHQNIVPDIAVFTNHGRKTHKTCVAKGKIKHVGSAYLEHWNFLKAQLPADRVRGAKITLPSPWFYHISYRKGKAYANGVYANDNEYFADIIVAYRRELEILYDAGCRNIQIDDPKLSCMSLINIPPKLPGSSCS
jgi:methionine synthase II (cobalamin-independent)